MKLEGKVAVVTGSGRGIGRACALRLAALGAHMVICDICLDSAKEFGEQLTAGTVMDEVKALRRRVMGVEADLTDKAAVNSAFDRILQEFGRIDILVNNVGGNQAKTGPLQGDSAKVSEEDLRFILDRNLLPTIFCCQAVIPSMVVQKWGRIVNIGSRTGIAVSFGAARASSYAAASVYGTAKAGVIQYTRVLAAELGPYGIRVNSIAPGTISTSRTQTFARAGSMTPAEVLKECPLGRIGEPEDVAKAVEFLCTDMSDYVTGQCIRVDGGRTLW